MWRNKSLFSLFMGSFYSLPSPLNLSYWWNISSLLSLVLIIQIASSLLLTMRYSANIDLAFESIGQKVGRDANYGWALRSLHANGASLFMALLYMHLGRGLYYKRYSNTLTWLVGVILILLAMLTAFLSYVLPWGQMSFWSATVITNLITAIPVWGPAIVMWVWGGYSVDNAALGRFYSLHFILPLVIGVLALLHLVALHHEGSSSPMGDFNKSAKIFFWPYFGVKDVFSAFMLIGVLLSITFLYPDVFGDPDNFFEANPMVTPVHIKPEWYFLFAYAILRCIPSKGVSVLALVCSIVVFILLPLGRSKFVPTLPYQVIFWAWTSNFVLLTWLGGCPVKDVFTSMAQVGGFVYFALLLGLLLV